MDKIKLKNLIKSLTKKKMSEQIGGMGKFKGGAADSQDASSPNRLVGQSSREQHHVEEAVTHQRPGLGPRHNPRKNIYKTTLGKLERRRWGGNQSMKRGKRYTLEQEIPLGDTDTKKEKETVSVNPVHNELKGPTR
jgi:hypothetical protein